MGICDFITVTISLWKTENLVLKTDDFWKQFLRFNSKKCNLNIRLKTEKDPQNTHEKKFQAHKTSTRKNSKTTKYPQENILDAWNTHEKRFRTLEDMMALWHKTHGI